MSMFPSALDPDITRFLDNSSIDGAAPPTCRSTEKSTALRFRFATSQRPSSHPTPVTTEWNEATIGSIQIDREAIYFH